MYSIVISLQDKITSNTNLDEKLEGGQYKKNGNLDQALVSHDGVFKGCAQEKNVKSQ